MRIYLVIYMLALSFGSCQFSDEKQREGARLDSLAKDSTRKAYNPYKTGQDTKLYDQQREVLGNVDSLVTPQDPGIPNH